MIVESNVIRDEELLDKLTAAREQLLREVRKAIIGQDDVVELVLLSLFVGGHSIISGVPGLAKTLLVRTIANVLDLSFKRIQFTPDLMPADITGTEIIEEDRTTGHRRLEFIRGPIFANIILADEINRTPPKTQAALLEAMEERQVTIDGEIHPLSPLFTVFATENPIEYEGTYPLPEAQLDRFLLKIEVEYPSAENEQQIVANWDAGFDARRLSRVDIRPLAEPDWLPQCRAEARNTRVEPGVQRYLVEIVRRTRTHPAVAYGASPRASVALLLCAKALSAIRGRQFVTPDDVRDIAPPVLRHRLSLRAEAELDGTTHAAVLADILNTTEIPR